MDLNEALGLVNRIYARLNARRPEIDKAEAYYNGDQPLNFATQAWREANAARYAGFSDNWCAPVVEAEAERLQPIGITGIPQAGARKLWDQLLYNEFDMQFSQGVVTALTAKRAFVIVWFGDDGDASVSVEHPSFVEIEYHWENPRKRRAALKTWVDEENEHATLYTATEIWKFSRKRSTLVNERKSQAEQGNPGTTWDGGWEPREVGNEQWPLTHSLGEVPVVEIGNRPTLKGDPLSEIQGVMPMQDAINLLWAYLFLAADYASMKARVVLGAEPPKVPILDNNGQMIGTRPLDLKDFAEKRIAFLQGENAKIDEWEAARLDVFTDVIEIAVAHIATQTRTPPTYLVSKTGMSNVSAEGLKAAEIGLVQKADKFINFTDPALREVARLIALVQGDEKLARAARLAKFQWKSREIRSEAQLADALLKKQSIGYPLEYLLELDGKSPSERRRILKLVEEDRARSIEMGVQAASEDMNGFAA